MGKTLDSLLASLPRSETHRRKGRVMQTLLLILWILWNDHLASLGPNKIQMAIGRKLSLFCILNAAFNLSTIKVWPGNSSLGCVHWGGDCPRHCKMFNNISDLFSLDATSIPQGVTINDVSRYCHVFPGLPKSASVENHCFSETLCLDTEWKLSHS